MGGSIVLLGGVLGLGGLWLAWLGGSPAYAALGAALVCSGVLLWRRRALGLGVYAATLLLMLAWSVWEGGLDYWALVPRMALLAVIGALLLTPWVDRPLVATHTHHRLTARACLAAAVSVVGLTALATSLGDPYDIAGSLAPAPAPGTGGKAGDASGDSPGGSPGSAGADWPAYGGSVLGRRHSTLADITPANVAQLAVAWTFHTGDMKGPNDPGETTFEVTPLKVGDSLYLCTPHNHVIALDAVNGARRWQFDPKIHIDRRSEHLTCRGVGYHEDAVPEHAAAAGATAGPACSQRILTSTMDARLFALDARTGQPCEDFGEHGVVSLWANMPNAKPGFYMPTSAPLVTHDLVIVGGAINDNVSVANPSGVVRAYDVHSGRLVWNWDAGNPDQTAPIAADLTYSAGAPNMWSAASADESLGLVYVPLGNKSPDQYGADRSPEVERFSSAIVALDLHTGRLRWVRQTVHHDLWDRDVPAQPSLLDLPVSGAMIPALIGPTKQGDIYVLDRRTGTPILPLREVPAPGGAVAGDHTAPTQPTSALNLAPAPLTEKAMWGATPVDQLICRIRFRSLRYEGRDTPPSLQGSIVYPGNTGVFNWGGVAVDPQRHAMIGATLQLAFVQQLIPRHDASTALVSDGVAAFGEDFGGQYAAKIGPFLSPLGLPCQQPPWGALAAADLTTGELLWRHRNGTVRDQLGWLPLPFRMGVPSLGGPLVTAGGVAFYSGTTDDFLRAYDERTGRQLWEARLPAGGQATPMTYRGANGKQMVVVAAGGHGSFGTRLGDAVIAYALP
jgi:quinoprotein glucose dehydrogenase